MKSKETQVIVEKKRKERFELVATFLPDVQLKSEPGKGLKLPSRVFELFYGLSQKFAKKDRKIKKLSQGQEDQRKEIIKMAQANDGLRGIISERDNFNLTASPTEKVTYDREKLRESTSALYPAVASETLEISFSLPIRRPGRLPIQSGVIEKAIREALINLGIPKEDLSKIMGTKINIKVDEYLLNKMIKTERVELLPETKKTEITWRVRVDPLKS